MDGLGAEVSAKIRSAIKAKLIELEAYVDDELPDYIMVMVANNRTKSQMEEDLGLFLNNNTTAFTNWLHAVLEKPGLHAARGGLSGHGSHFLRSYHRRQLPHWSGHTFITRLDVILRMLGNVAELIIINTMKK